MIFDKADLYRLAAVFGEARGMRLQTLGSQIANNHKLFTRLRDGEGCSVDAATVATRWFIENWPDDLPWPDGVADPRSADAEAA